MDLHTCERKLLHLLDDLMPLSAADKSRAQPTSSSNTRKASAGCDGGGTFVSSSNISEVRSGERRRDCGSGSPDRKQSCVGVSEAEVKALRTQVHGQSRYTHTASM